MTTLHGENKSTMASEGSPKPGSVSADNAGQDVPKEVLMARELLSAATKTFEMAQHIRKLEGTIDKLRRKMKKRDDSDSEVTSSNDDSDETSRDSTDTESEDDDVAKATRRKRRRYSSKKRKTKRRQKKSRKKESKDYKKPVERPTTSAPEKVMPDSSNEDTKEFSVFLCQLCGKPFSAEMRHLLRPHILRCAKSRGVAPPAQLQGIETKVRAQKTKMKAIPPKRTPPTPSAKRPRASHAVDAIEYQPHADTADSNTSTGAIIDEVKDEQANQSCETEIYVDNADETPQEPELPTCPETSDSIRPQFVLPMAKTRIKALTKPGKTEVTNTLVVNSKFHKNAEDLEMNCADCGLRLAKVARVHHAKVCRKTPVCLYCAATFTSIAALEEHKPACKAQNWQDHTVRLLQHEIHVPDNRLQLVPESQLKRYTGSKDDVNVDIKIRRNTIRCIQPESVKRGIIFHVCMKCDQQFSTPQELGVHKQDPENCQRFKLERKRPGFRQGGRFCHTCMKHYPNHQLFTAHASTCKAASRDKMADGVGETGSNNKTMHNCFVCYKGFDSADELKRHRQQWHLTAKGDTSNCWVCGNMFKSFKELMAHHEEEHKGLAEEPKPKRMRPAPDQSHLVLTSGSELNIDQPQGDLEATVLVNETLAMLTQMQQENAQPPIDPTAPMQMHPDELKSESTHETSIQKHYDDSVIEPIISTSEAPRSLRTANTSLRTDTVEKAAASWQGLNISDQTVSQSDSFDQNTSTINLKDLDEGLNTSYSRTEESLKNFESVSAKKRKGPRIIIQNTKPEKSFKMRTEKVQTKHKVNDEQILTNYTSASDSTQLEHNHDHEQSDNTPVHESESKQIPEHITATPASKHIRIDSDSDTDPCTPITDKSLTNKPETPLIKTIQQTDKLQSTKANADVKKLVDALGASGTNSNALQEALKGFSVNTPIKFVTGDPNLLLNINKLAGNAKQVMLPGNKRGYVLAVGQSPANVSLPKAALEKLGIKGNVAQNEATNGENKASPKTQARGVSENTSTLSANEKQTFGMLNENEKAVVDSLKKYDATTDDKQPVGSSNAIENDKLFPGSNVEDKLSDVASNEPEKSSKVNVESKLSDKVGSNEDSITKTKVNTSGIEHATNISVITTAKKAERKRTSKSQRKSTEPDIEPIDKPTKAKRLKSVSPPLDINSMPSEPMDAAVQDICSKHIKKSEVEKRDGLKRNKYSKRDSSEGRSSKSRRSTRHKTYTKIKSPPAESESLSIENSKIQKEQIRDTEATTDIINEAQDTLKLKLKLDLATEKEIDNVKDVHARQSDLIVEQSSVSEKTIETKKCAKDKHRKSKKNTEDSRHLDKDIDMKHKKDKPTVSKRNTSSNKTKQQSISYRRLSSSEERSKSKMSELDTPSSKPTKLSSKASSNEKDTIATTKITETFSASLSGAIDAKLTSLRTSSRRRHKTDTSSKSENTKISKVATNSHKSSSKSSSHKSKPLELVKSAGAERKHSTTNQSPAKPARRTITSGGIEMLVSDTDDKIVCSSCRIVMTSIVEIAKHKCSVGVVSNKGMRLVKEADVTSLAAQDIPRKESLSRHALKNRSDAQAHVSQDSRSPKLRSYYSKRHSHRSNNKSTSSSKDIATEPRSATEGSLNQKKDLGPELVNVEDAELSDGCNVDIVGDGDDL